MGRLPRRRRSAARGVPGTGSPSGGTGKWTGRELREGSRRGHDGARCSTGVGAPLLVSSPQLRARGDAPDFTPVTAHDRDTPPRHRPLTSFAHLFLLHATPATRTPLFSVAAKPTLKGVGLRASAPTPIARGDTRENKIEPRNDVRPRTADYEMKPYPMLGDETEARSRNSWGASFAAFVLSRSVPVLSVGNRSAFVFG